MQAERQMLIALCEEAKKTKETTLISKKILCPKLRTQNSQPKTNPKRLKYELRLS
jgi:hypothetical protein